MSTNPIDVVLTAAIERAGDAARAALHVQGVFGPERAKPLADYADTILDAVEQVRS